MEVFLNEVYRAGTVAQVHTLIGVVGVCRQNVYDILTSKSHNYASFMQKHSCNPN